MAKTPKKIDRLLILKTNIYQVKIGIPSAIRHHFDGKTSLVHSTNTGDIKIARLRRDEIEYQARAMFRAAKTGTLETVRDQGAALRQAWLNADKHSVDEGEFSERDIAMLAVEQTIDSLRGPKAAPEQLKQFEDAFQGLEDVNEHVAAWLKEAKFTSQTAREWTSITNRLNEWCAGEGVKLSQVTRKVSGRYATQVLSAMHPSTARKHVSCIKTYWKYLIARGHVDDDAGNVWTDLALPKKSKRGDKEAQASERPLSKAERETLLNGGNSNTFRAEVLAELVRFGILSGMRLNEIMGQTVESATAFFSASDGTSVQCFDLSLSKTPAGVRVIPVHSALIEAVAKRCKGKSKDELLFPEWSDTNNQSGEASKAFTKYRRALGVKDERDDRRRSLVNFHSTRKTFVTQAHHAGFPETTIADIVGHSTGQKKLITFGVYSSGASIDQKRECVEAVKL